MANIFKLLRKAYMIIKKNFLKSLTASRERGQGMSEYIIVVALIAVASIGVFAAFGTTIKHQVAGLAAEISGNSADTALLAAKTSAIATESKAKAKTTMSTYDSQNGGAAAE